MLRNKTTLITYEGPAVLFCSCQRRGSGNKSFNSHNRIFFESRWIKSIPVVGDLFWFFMKAPANAVTRKITYYFISRFFRLRFNQVSDV